MADLYLRCRACGWCHVAVPPDEPGDACCFRCGGRTFEEADPATVPRGVTLQALCWPLPEADHGHGDDDAA